MVWAPGDLALTDVVMPLMSGVELVDRLRECRPALHCPFISGYTQNAIAERQLLRPGTLFIEKPFSLDRLDAMVRRALVGGAPSD